MTKIKNARLGQALRYPESHGDVWTATWGGDDAVYAVADDTYGIARSCYSNLALFRITGDTPPELNVETLNPMTEFGHFSQFSSEDDGMWKANGLTCVDGTLYMSVSRHAHQAKQRYFIQETWDSSIVKSEDYGKSWSRTPKLGHAMFPGQTFSTPFFIQYGKDGRGDVDGAENYVYAVSSNGAWNNTSSMTLGRVQKDRIGRLDATDWEFIHGFDGDGLGEPIWRPRHEIARQIFRAPDRTSMTGIHYIQPLGLYILPQWHWLHLENYRGEDPKNRWHGTRFEFYQSAKPWGPWDHFHTQDFAESWYNPCIPSKFISANGRNLWLFVSGDFTNHETPGSPYGLWMLPMLLELENDPLPTH